MQQSEKTRGQKFAFSGGVWGRVGILRKKKKEERIVRKKKKGVIHLRSKRGCCF